MTVEVKKWFIQKSFNQQEQYILSVADMVVERETEKAVFINAQSDFGNIHFWCPKSCLIQQSSESRDGMEINHPKFGKGIIKSESNGIAEIDFNGTIKKIASSFITKMVQC